MIAGALAYTLVQKPAKESAETAPSSANDIVYPNEIKDELHSRVKTFFSEDGFQKLQNSFIVVSSVVPFHRNYVDDFWAFCSIGGGVGWRWKPLCEHAGTVRGWPD